MVGRKCPACLEWSGKMTDETGWVIERGDSPASEPKYWAAGQTDANRSSAWTSNHMHAIRFARRLDARRVSERVMKGIEVRIAEHSWTARDPNLYGSGDTPVSNGEQ